MSKQRRYELRVHDEIRQRIPEPGLTTLAREVLHAIDMMMAQTVSDTMLKLTRMSVAPGMDGKPVPIKLTLAKGNGQDAVHLTLPRPLRDSVRCDDCDGVGWTSLKSRELCPTCRGLANVTPPSPTPAVPL